MRQALCAACRFDWSKISPAIFGALFQSVMDPAERRAQGAHYTTEQNILKVIEPLFLDDLRAEFAQVQNLKTRRAARLRAFHAKLGSLTFLDPACGCGNFLVIAYREVRALGLEVIRNIISTLLLRELSRNQVSKKTLGRRRLAQAAMAHRDTSVSALCRELGISPVTLYRHVGPQGQLREQGEKVLAP